MQTTNVFVWAPVDCWFNGGYRSSWYQPKLRYHIRGLIKTRRVNILPSGNYRTEWVNKTLNKPHLNTVRKNSLLVLSDKSNTFSFSWEKFCCSSNTTWSMNIISCVKRTIKVDDQCYLIIKHYFESYARIVKSKQLSLACHLDTPWAVGLKMSRKWQLVKA